MKIRPVGSELFHTDGRTDMTTLTDILRKFANVPKNKWIGIHSVYVETLTSIAQNVLHVTTFA
jgi:hypothetical protein